MSNLLYIIAITMVVLWAVGYFGFHLGELIHILLAIAIISVLIRIIRGNKVL